MRFFLFFLPVLVPQVSLLANAALTPPNRSIPGTKAFHDLHFCFRIFPAQPPSFSFSIRSFLSPYRSEILCQVFFSHPQMAMIRRLWRPLSFSSPPLAPPSFTQAPFFPETTLLFRHIDLLPHQSTAHHPLPPNHSIFYLSFPPLHVSDKLSCIRWFFSQTLGGNVSRVTSFRNSFNPTPFFRLFSQSPLFPTEPPWPCQTSEP